MTEIRNILLIGRTGGGKSTLGNVLASKDNNFEEIFKESSGTTSETKELHKEEFEVEINGEKIKYQVIDTVGIGDTKLTPREVLNRVAEACYEISRGLNQILFVVRGRFTKEELEAYNLLRSIIFDENITNFTTIVKTGFASFEKEEACEEDRKKLEEEDPTFAEIIRSCNKLIYVDNTPIPIDGRADKILSAKVDREVSRKLLFNHLIKECGNYRPVSLNRLNERIGSYMTEKEQLQKKLEELEKMKRDDELRSEEERRRYREERKHTGEKLTELEAKIEDQTRALLRLNSQ